MITTFAALATRALQLYAWPLRKVISRTRESRSRKDNIPDTELLVIGKTKFHLFVPLAEIREEDFVEMIKTAEFMDNRRQRIS